MIEKEMLSQKATNPSIMSWHPKACCGRTFELQRSSIRWKEKEQQTSVRTDPTTSSEPCMRTDGSKKTIGRTYGGKLTNKQADKHKD